MKLKLVFFPLCLIFLAIAIAGFCLIANVSLQYPGPYDQLQLMTGQLLFVTGLGMATFSAIMAFMEIWSH